MHRRSLGEILSQEKSSNKVVLLRFILFFLKRKSNRKVGVYTPKHAKPLMKFRKKKEATEEANQSSIENHIHVLIMLCKCEMNKESLSQYFKYNDYMLRQQGFEEHSRSRDKAL